MKNLFVYNGFKRCLLSIVVTLFVTSCSINEPVLTRGNCGEVEEKYDALKYVANTYFKDKNPTNSRYKCNFDFYELYKRVINLDVKVYYSFTKESYLLSNVTINQLAAIGTYKSYEECSYKNETYNFSLLKFYEFGNEFYAKFFYSNDDINYIDGESYYFFIVPDDFGMFGSPGNQLNAIWFPFVSYEVFNSWGIVKDNIVTEISGDDFIVNYIDGKYIYTYPNISNFSESGHVLGDCRWIGDDISYGHKEFEIKRIDKSDVGATNPPDIDENFLGMEEFRKKFDESFFERLYDLSLI